nr:unnamed protein product [Digitaria exilis]
MDLSSVTASPSYAKAVDTYKKAVAVAAATTVTAYTALARSMSRELLPDELRATARWAASVLRGRFLLPRQNKPRAKTIFIAQFVDVEGGRVENRLYHDARAYLATRIDPDAMDQLCLTACSDQLLPHPHQQQRQVASMVPGDSMTDVFEGVEFTWLLTTVSAAVRRRGDEEIDGGDYGVRAYRGGGGDGPQALALSFDAEHMEVALRRYVPSIVAEIQETRRRERTLSIFMNKDTSSWEGFNHPATSSWQGFNHNHPATFDTVALDPALKQSIVDDLDRFLGRRDYYRRIGKAWKRGYLLYGPPGTGNDVPDFYK